MNENERGFGMTDPIRAAQVVFELDRYLARELPRADQSLPKYQQLHDTLMRSIRDGVVEPGDKLPSEAELTSMAPFSLGTVQKTMKMLMDEGVVVRKTGAGTVVRAVDRRMDQPLHCRFSRGDDAFLPVFPTILQRETAPAGHPFTKTFPTDANIVRLDRAIRIGDEFTLFTRFYCDADRFPIFAMRPFEDLNTENFKKLIQQETAIRVSRIDQKIRHAPTPREVAGIIGVAEGTDVMTIKAVAYDRFDAIAYCQQFFIPPNDLELTIESRVLADFDA